MLKGKVALITGGATGIGKETVKLFGKNGARLVICYYLDSEQVAAEELKLEIEQNKGEAEIYQCDITDYEQCKSMIDFTVDRFAQIDILVNNASYVFSKESVLDISIEDFDKVIDTNLKGTYYLTIEAVYKMMKQKSGGSIISLSSTAVDQPRDGTTPYSAAKAGVELIMKSLAQGFGKYNIRFNVVAPGPTNTEALSGFFTEGRKETTKENEIPLGRLGTTEDIARAILYFASDDAKYITGQRIAVDGGRTIR